jgi:hypothetical protein
VAALALLPRRDVPYTPVWGTPVLLDVITISINKCVNSVKGRPQAAFFFERVPWKGGAAPSRAPPAIGLELLG